MILGEACAISLAGGLIGFLISTVLMRRMQQESRRRVPAADPAVRTLGRGGLHR